MSSTGLPAAGGFPRIWSVHDAGAWAAAYGCGNARRARRPDGCQAGLWMSARTVVPRLSGGHVLAIARRGRAAEMAMPDGDAAAQAQRAGENALLLEAHAAELGRLQSELGEDGPEPWRSPAGRAFQARLYDLAADLGACRDALERAASARRTVSAAEQFEAWE